MGTSHTAQYSTNAPIAEQPRPVNAYTHLLAHSAAPQPVVGQNTGRLSSSLTTGVATAAPVKVGAR